MFQFIVDYVSLFEVGEVPEHFLFGLLHLIKLKPKGMEYDKDGFMGELQEVHKMLAGIVSKYDMKDEYVSIVLTGVFREEDDGSPTIEAVYSYSVDDLTQFYELLDFIGKSYKHGDDEKPDKGDMLRGFFLN